MSPTLNWYKPVSVTKGDQELNGLIVVSGEQAVKSGTLIQLGGVDYKARPSIRRFQLHRRRGFLSQRRYQSVDRLPTRFSKTHDFGYSAWTIPDRLSGKHPRLLNRTYRFSDDLGNWSADLSTNRYGRMQISGFEIYGSGGARGHIPGASIGFHAFAEPIKDPTVEVSLLVAGGERGSERGYGNLDDLVIAELESLTVEGPKDPRLMSGREGQSQRVSLESEVEKILSHGPEVSIQIDPKVRDIRRDDIGHFYTRIEIYGTGRFSFAMQGICSPDWDETEDQEPVDDDLRDVIVSDVYSINVSEDGSVSIG